MGREPTVTLVPAEDKTAMLPALAANDLQGEVRYIGPIRAPIEKGQHLGELVIAPEGLSEIRLPLVADRDIPRGGFLIRVGTAAQYLVNRFSDAPQGAM